MALRIERKGKPDPLYLEAIANDLEAVATGPATGEDVSAAPGRGAVILLPVDATLCISVNLSVRFIQAFSVTQPPLGECEFFTITNNAEEGETTETTRNTRAQKSRGKKTDLSNVSYNHIKFSTDGLATRPTRAYGGSTQELKYISERFPRVLTRDCICHFIGAAFGGGAESDRRLPSHFLYGKSNFRVDYVDVPLAELAAYSV